MTRWLLDRLRHRVAGCGSFQIEAGPCAGGRGTAWRCGRCGRTVCVVRWEGPG